VRLSQQVRKLAGQVDQGAPHGSETARFIERHARDLRRGIWPDAGGGNSFPGTPGKGNGRDHNHYGFTVWLAGGGVKGGTVYGATDEFG